MIKSCGECHQYMARESELGLPAFCRYFAEEILINNPICRHYREGRVPEVPVPFSSPSTAASPYNSPADSEDFQAQEMDKPFDPTISQFQDQNPVDGQPKAGRHLVRIITVSACRHNFEEYSGIQARLKMKILDGPEAGKILFDNVSLPHSKESNGMQRRRVHIAYRLGLIQWGTIGTVQVNWKLLEGVVCLVNVAYKSLGGRIVPTVDNYERQ